MIFCLLNEVEITLFIKYNIFLNKHTTNYTAYFLFFERLLYIVSILPVFHQFFNFRNCEDMVFKVINNFQ